MKKILALFLGILMAASLISCGNSSSGGAASGSAAASASATASSSAPAASGDSYKLVIGHVYSEDSLENKQMSKLKDLIESKTSGKVSVEIYPNEQLGPEKDLCEQVVMGTLDATFSEGSMWATVTNKPEFGVFGLPFQYSSIDAMNDAISNMIRPELGKIAEDTSVIPISTVGSGFRHVFTVKKPITKLEDFKGLKIRVPAVTLYVDIFKDLGCNPTTTAFSECYQALQQGVVDGCEIDIPNCVQQNWQECVHYMTYTYHLAALNVVCINRDKWNSYPADIQNAITEACKEAEEYSFELRSTADSDYIGKIEAAGVKITKLDSSELARLRAACQPIYDEFEGYGLSDLLNKIADMNASHQQ